MAITAPRSFSVQTVLYPLWQSLPITAEYVTFPAAKLPFPVSVADKRSATAEASQAVRLLAAALVPPGVAAFVAAKGPFSADNI